MSYPKDLDEYEMSELETEIDRRMHARWAGVCDYCGRAPSLPPCKFPSRHKSHNVEVAKPKRSG